MSIVSVQPKDFILALFIRDDGERFLLGDGGYDFKDSQLHFVGNTIENDEVAKQGTDGTLLAGQVRRSAIQSFDGYIGDATVTKEAIEQMRRDFIAFFMKGHHFRVVYVDCARNAWQRKGGYLVDAPEVKELWQIHPEYHVALNFEDVNYYVYDENADGDEILAIVQSVPISSEVEGGLEWDANGAISDAAQMDNETKTVTGSNIHVTDAVVAPFADLEIEGNTSQNGTPTPSAPVPVRTVTGENVVKIYGKNLFATPASATVRGITFTLNPNGTYDISGTATARAQIIINTDKVLENGATYTLKANQPLGNVIARVESNDGETYLRTNFIIDSSAQQQTGTYDGTNANRCVMVLRVESGKTVSITGLGIQLELGSTATDFEPYQGQDYEINLGKNLFDATNLSPSTTLIATVSNKTNNGFDINATVSQGSQWSAYVEYTLNLDANTTYTISRTASVVSGSSYSNYGAMRTHIGNTYGTATTASSLTFTTDSTGTVGILFYAAYNQAAASGSTVVRISDLQLEKGSQATSYAPYFTPIELGGLGDDGAGGYLYQDYIYPSGGKWYVHKETASILMGSITSWAQGAGDTQHRQIRQNFGSSYGAVSGLGFANIFVEGGATWTSNHFGIATSGNLWVGTSEAMASASAFVEWLNNHNAVLYYALATPTDTEITNTALLAQLNNLKEGGTLAGINNIAIVPAVGNETGTLEIQYYTKYSPVPIGGGYVWEEGGEGGPTTVINESIAEVYPIWTVPGPALNPTLENATTGEQIEFVGMVGEGQTLVVDMGAQTALLNGLNVISSMAGEFISLQVGQNTLLYSASGDAGASEIGWSPIVG